MECGKFSFSVSYLRRGTLKKQGAWGRNPPDSVQKTPLFGAEMYGRNSRVTHPTENSLPAKLAAGDMEKFG